MRLSETSICSSAVLPIFAVLLTAIIAVSTHAHAARGGENKPHVLFLISEDPDNYKAHETMPSFAKTLEATQGYKVTVIKGEGELTAFRFPGLSAALAEADLL